MRDTVAARHARRRITKHAPASKDDRLPVTAAARHLIISTDSPAEAELVRSALARCIVSLDLTETWHVLTLVSGERFGVWLIAGPGRAEL